MIASAQTANTPVKFSRVFKKDTRLSIQIRGAFNVYIGHEQGEVQSAINGLGDGLLLDQASTKPPYDFWWQGELWFATSAANSQFTIMIATETS